MQISRRNLSIGILAVAIATIGATVSLGGASAKTKTPINTIGSPGVAIKGYDPVAYFKDGKPRRGSNLYTFKYKGVTWRFASAENRAAFIAAPDKYEPAYGGYCAYGVAKGALAKIEPTAWAIRNGKLYLNYDAEVQGNWSKDPAGYIRAANGKWPKLVGKK